jgi:membrane-associated PAP2 superfamily phosphatase
LKAPQPSRDAAWAVFGAVLLVAWEASGLDIVVVRWFGTAGGFPWREAWIASAVLHDGGRWAAGLLLGVQVLDAVRPLVPGPSRPERLGGLLAMSACLLAVPALKRASATSCPWSLAEFGGVARYVPHWSIGVPDGGPGHCFPSGHAVAAFAFLAGYFVLRAHRPALARTWLAGVLAAGVLFGGAQVARGAHYPSHVMWSAWVCWVLCALVTGYRGPGTAGTGLRRIPLIPASGGRARWRRQSTQAIRASSKRHEQGESA